MKRFGNSCGKKTVPSPYAPVLQSPCYHRQGPLFSALQSRFRPSAFEWADFWCNCPSLSFRGGLGWGANLRFPVISEKVADTVGVGTAIQKASANRPTSRVAPSATHRCAPPSDNCSLPSAVARRYHDSGNSGCPPTPQRGWQCPALSCYSGMGRLGTLLDKY